MKLTLVFLAILGVSTAAVLPAAKTLNRSTRSLNDDWADLIALIPTEEIVAIVAQYIAEDEEVQHAVEYMQSDSFKASVQALTVNSAFIAFVDYLEAAGLNVYTWINRFLVWLELDELTRVASSRITGGIAGLVADIKAVLPVTEIKALYHDKLETSEAFAELVALLSSDEAQTLYAAVKANEEYQHVRAALEEYGLDMDGFFDFWRSVLGIE